jgi:hypothetical protein
MSCSAANTALRGHISVHFPADCAGGRRRDRHAVPGSRLQLFVPTTAVRRTGSRPGCVYTVTPPCQIHPAHTWRILQGESAQEANRPDCVPCCMGPLVYPFNTVDLPLNYSGNPGVNSQVWNRPDSPAAWGSWRGPSMDPSLPPRLPAPVRYAVYP